MKKAITIILFVLAIVAIAFSVFTALTGAIGAHIESESLANTPGTSGSDYLGIALASGFYFLVAVSAAIIALILSAITAKIANITPIKNCSLIMCILSGGLIWLIFFVPFISGVA